MFKGLREDQILQMQIIMNQQKLDDIRRAAMISPYWTQPQMPCPPQPTCAPVSCSMPCPEPAVVAEASKTRGRPRGVIAKSKTKGEGKAKGKSKAKSKGKSKGKGVISKSKGTGKGRSKEATVECQAKEKRPLTAYQIYVQKAMELLKKEYPGLGSEYLSIASKAWNICHNRGEEQCATKGKSTGNPLRRSSDNPAVNRVLEALGSQ